MRSFIPLFPANSQAAPRRIKITNKEKKIMSNCPNCKLPQSVTEYCVTVEDMCYRYESVFIKPEELNA